MARDIHSNAVTEISSKIVRPVLFLKIDSTPEARFWSGIGEITFDGEVYLGAGGLARISTVKEQSLMQATGTRFELTGIPSDNLFLALNAQYQDRLAVLWLALVRDDLSIIGRAINLFSGRTDTMTIEENGQTATVSVTVENKLIDLEKPKVRYFTDADQKEQYPNDKGLEYNVAINDGRQVAWGR